jgi:EAL domain-containing protein (putative c-di-GMP-specific phosphodiesterase class I)
LELHYQPIISTVDRRLHKAEGFIRLTHPTRGSIPPSVFIPIIEQTDLMIKLTDWVLRRATEQVSQWRATLHPDFQIAVNMPPAYLVRCLDETESMMVPLTALSVPYGAVSLEITEGAMLDVTPELRGVLERFRAIGFTIALDDFGVGYSNFGQLDKLQLDVLKLDQTFVHGLDMSPERIHICEAIVMMAHRLGLLVVAEGVETTAQHDVLQRIGVDYLQGYLYCRPLPPADLETWAKGDLAGCR